MYIWFAKFNRNALKKILCTCKWMKVNKIIVEDSYCKSEFAENKEVLIHCD